MKARSPVLGYNHNVRYAGRTWHVQTEDSGVQNPHIFTHLFNDGTIVASKKTDYDAASEVPAVQKLMQAQHKLMMRDLKSGTFDEKIEKYFGPIVREPEVAAAQDDRPTVPNLDEHVRPEVQKPEARGTAAPVGREEGQAAPPASVAPLPISKPPPAPPAPRASSPPPVPSARPARTATLTPARPAVTVNARSSAAAPPTIGGRSAISAPRTPPPTIGSGRSGVTQTPRPAADGVVMARPTVIVGSSKKGDSADFWKSNERRAQPDPQFGGDLISEKSLDEVILAYLSEDVPKK